MHKPIWNAEYNLSDFVDVYIYVKKIPTNLYTVWPEVGYYYSIKDFDIYEIVHSIGNMVGW